MSLLERDSVLVSTTENGDPIVDLPFTRVNNVEGLGRSANTAYSVGNVVYTDSNLSVALKCTTAGTTSDSELDISGVSVGESVEDGSVVWKVIPRGIMQGATSTTNGVEGLVPAPMAGSVNRYLNADGTFKEVTVPVTSVNGQTGDVVVIGVPTGFIAPYGGSAVPSGWLACNGAAVSRTTYAALFAAIGTTYGTGNGSTTFNLPNMGTSLVSAVSTGNLAVKGNGLTIGITNGTALGAIYKSSGDYIHYYPAGYGVAPSASSPSTAGDFDGTIGLTTDGTKSGMIVPVAATKTTVKYCIKY